MAWSIDFSTVVSSSASEITYQSFDSANGQQLVVKLLGTGLQYDGSGFLTGGTVNSMALVDPSGAGTVLQTVTMVGGLAAADIGAMLSSAASLSSQMQTWNFQFAEIEPAFSSTSITLFGLNGERIVIAGSGFVESGYTGTVSSVTHYDAGNVVLHQVTGLNLSTYTAAAALGSDEAVYTYLARGQNVVTGLSNVYPELDGGLGNDTIAGFGSSARVTYDSDVTGAIVADLTAGTVTGGGGSDSISNVNNLDGTPYGDSITGNSSANNIWAGNGNDTVTGLAGSDFLQGADGNDSLIGGEGDDQVNGDIGNDTIVGNAGINNLNGQGGSDVYVYTRDAQNSFVSDFGARIFESSLEGSNVVPGVSSGSQGYVQALLNEAQNSLRIYVNLFGADVTGSQTPSTTSDNVTSIAIRGGTVTQNGSVVFGIIGPNSDLDGDRTISTGSSNPPSSFIQTTWDGAEGAGTTLAAQRGSLTAGNLYLDVRTSGFPNGELRGQLVERDSAHADKIDLTALNLGSLESIDSIVSSTSDGARIFTVLNGAQSQMFLLGVSPTELDASDFILTTAITADNIVGFGGRDDLFGAGGNDTIVAGADNDRLFGEDGDDVLDGGLDDDQLLGGNGTDALYGQNGSDWLDGDAGNDYMLGGVGNDTYIVDSTFDLVDEGGAFPAFIGSGLDIDTIRSTADWFWDVYSVGENLVIEEGAAGSNGAGTTVVGSIFSGTLTGNSGTNIMFGRGGSDTYRAGDGIDYISLSLLGLTEQNAYVGVNGSNTVIVDQRQSGAFSYDIVFDFESGKDKLDVSSYHYSSVAQVLAVGHNDGAGNSYYALGDGLDYLFLVGKTTSQVQAGDFII